jgi:putative ABC transport system permease protein
LLPLGDGECILVKYEPNQDGSTEDGDIYVLNANTPITLTVKITTLSNPIGFANSVATLVVPDSIHNELLRSDLPATRVISINGTDKTENREIYDELSALLNGSPYLVCSSARAAEIIHENSSTFLLLGFLVVLFFIASGSI